MENQQNFLIDGEKNFKKWYRGGWGIVFFVLIILIAVFAAWFIYQYFNVLWGLLFRLPDSKVSEQSAPYELSLILDSNDAYLGNVDAPLKIVEFGDFRCPVCQRNYSIIRELAFKYPQTVQVYWKNFPITSVESIDFALAAECANSQGKFWPFHDRLFQDQASLTVDDLPLVAMQVGLNQENFNECLSGKVFMMNVQEDFDAAQRISATGTPTFLINGYKIEGYMPMAVWEELVGKVK
jgi:protein-disulfide isomerase